MEKCIGIVGSHKVVNKQSYAEEDSPFIIVNDFQLNETVLEVDKQTVQNEL